ncbi:MAG: ASCH domain-containing protein [Oscillospiraceae bacterium]|nr:ASCH domain-containing protein [Oscillospiraceae bacterium]
MSMRAFTAHQPYAYAIVAGLKQYETRPRRTNIRGRVAVHAGLRDITGNEVNICETYIPQGTILAMGAVVGTVEIVDCLPVENIVDGLTEQEKALGDYSPGRWVWVLKNPVMFRMPIYARGKQGWWNWEERE